MLFSTFLAALRRRWLVATAGLCVTICLAVAALSFVPPTYEATASVLLLPKGGTGAQGENPYLALGGLQPTTDAVARAMLDSQVQKSLADRGARGNYVVDTDRATNGPIIEITAEDPSAAVALTTMRLVVEQIPRTLDSLQQAVNVPTRARMSLTILTEDRQATTVVKTRIRALVASVGIGLALTFAAVVIVDGYLNNRRSRREAAAADSSVMIAPGDRPAPRGGRRSAPPGRRRAVEDTEHADTVRIRL
jgi:capsular polysaccharide biosynthesis protein